MNNVHTCYLETLLKIELLYLEMVLKLELQNRTRLYLEMKLKIELLCPVLVTFLDLAHMDTVLTPFRLAVGKGLNLELVFECVVVTTGVEMMEKLTFTDERERERESVCVCV